MGCFTVLVLVIAFLSLVRWLARRARVETSGKPSLSRNEYGPRLEMVQDRQTASSIPLRWVGPNDTVTIARRNVGGMIYLGSAQRRAYSGFAGGTFIDPDLPVARGRFRTSLALAFPTGRTTATSSLELARPTWTGWREDGKTGAVRLVTFFSSSTELSDGSSWTIRPSRRSAC